MALRHAKEQQAKVLAICNTNGATIPRSPTPCSTPTLTEIAVAPPRRSSPSWSPATWWATLAQVRGIMWADEVAAVVQQLQEMPGRSRRC